MRKFWASAAAGFLFLVGISVSAHAAIKGNYVEVRSADVYTGPCFANAEVGLEGKQAILAWRVSQGSWKGVSLDGLSVVAVSRLRRSRTRQPSMSGRWMSSVIASG